MTLEIISLVVGLVISFILFRHFPGLSAGYDVKSDSFLSVIIPARNEEKNLPLLLADLKDQVGVSYEVICVDDGSSDRTRAIAEGFGVQVISVTDKPADWLGKSWACQKGAQAAKGKLFLFVDADVRLGPDALKCLLGTYGEKDQPLSVLPYHRMEKAYEQLSLFFNLTQVSSNGLVFGVFYLIWTLELTRIGKKIGNFHFLNIIFYPLSLTFFMIVFIGSTIKRLFHLKSPWKGRKV